MLRSILLQVSFPLAMILPLASAASLEVPKLTGSVNDLAGLLSADQSEALEGKLRGLETTDSTQIAVLIIPSLEDEALEDFSERVATAWRLGEKARDNGALLFIAMKERQVRIEVGYGLESVLTDALCRRIIETEIIPSFREGAYYRGIDDALTAMIQVVRGVYKAADRPRRASRGGGGGRSAFDLILFFMVPFLWFLGSTGKWGGGILGAGAGAYLAYHLFGYGLPLVLGGAMGAAVGIFLGALIRAAGHSSSGRSGGGPFHYGGRSGGWGGGFGGGFGGGGFSGGGGSFGGGGASGRW